MKERELPDGWEWKRLDEIAEINIRFDKNSFDDETEVTFLPMRCVEELTGRMDTSIEKKYGEIKTGYTPIQEGDLLFAKITPCIENGKIAIARNLKNGIGFASTEFHTLKFSPDNETKFYFFYLMQENIRQEAARNMTGTAGQHRVPATFLKKLKVPVPPLPIQRQIVAILDQAEAVKRQRQEADALTGALLQSVFLEMFGDPVRNEKGWEVKAVEEICETSRPITYGIVQPGEETDDGIPIVRPSDLLDTYVNNNIGLKKVDPKIESEYPRSRLKGGEFLISVRGTMGPMSIAGPDLADANLSRGVALVAPNSTCCSEYLLFLFKNPTMQQVVVDTSKGIGLKQFNLIDLKKMQIPLPPLALQQQFARIVLEVERIRERQAASGKEIEGLCEGLMQRAFAGELSTGNA